MTQTPKRSAPVTVDWFSALEWPCKDKLPLGPQPGVPGSLPTIYMLVALDVDCSPAQTWCAIPRGSHINQDFFHCWAHPVASADQCHLTQAPSEPPSGAPGWLSSALGHEFCSL